VNDVRFGPETGHLAMSAKLAPIVFNYNPISERENNSAVGGACAWIVNRVAVETHKKV
jgi:hypothetical protein